MILPVISLLIGLSSFFTALAYWRMGVLDYLVAGILWLATAVGSLIVQIPYLVYSEEENLVTTSTQDFTSAESMLAWVFLLLGIVMFFHVLYLMFKKPDEKWGRP